MPKQATRSTRTPTSRSSSARSKSHSAPARKASPPARRSAGSAGRGRRSSSPSFSWSRLSLDRKLDFLGIFLALVGFLTLLSLISTERGSVTGAWINTLNKVAGWGTWVLPIALMTIGLWLVFRNLESLPQLSTERLTGVIMLYLNLLAWLHLFAGGSWEQAELGAGGGYVGAFFQRALVNALGVAGGVIVLVAWLVVAIIFTFDISIPGIYEWLGQLFAGKDRRGAGSYNPSAFPASHAQNENLPRVPESLPSDFRPLPGQASSRPPARSRPAPAQHSAVEEHPAVKTPVKTSLDKASATAPAHPAAPPSVWALPKVDEILDPATPAAQQTNVDQERARLIEDTLASFGAPAHVVDISRGPTITRFGVEPDFIESRSGRMRVRVSKIASLADDLSLALAAPRIRIQAPVPGRSYVGIEVPNIEISHVSMREVLDSEAFRKIKSSLRFTIGKDVAGKPVSADLAAMPHLLIAGTTGSGKSVCVNSVLTCLLLNNSPVDLRLVLVDPKRVELTNYNGIPHLLAPVVVDTERVIGALQWLQREMDARYHRFSAAGSRNILDYNSKHPAEKLQYIIAVIDELADLMMLSPDETERAITRLAQLARATGIHLILATQRPSVDVVTGLIKANFPARIAFAVASGVDSRVILDQPGAERLLGRGDMLFQAPDAPAPVRLQGVYVSDPEIQRLVDYWRTQAAMQSGQAQPGGGELPIDMLPSGIPLKQGELWDIEEEGDPLISEAVDLVRREGRASITMLQRRMRIGYTRAARIIDALEDKGIISPALPNSQVREVLDYGPTTPPAEE